MTFNVTVLMQVRQLTESSITQRQWYAQKNCCIGCSISVNIDNALDIVNITLHLIQ